MDPSLGGDSLILASASSAVVGVLDLRTATPHIDTIHMQVADSLKLIGTSLRVLRGNNLFVTMHPTSSWGCVGRIFKYDIAAATYQLRTDVDCPNRLTIDGYGLSGSADSTHAGFVPGW